MNAPTPTVARPHDAFGGVNLHTGLRCERPGEKVRAPELSSNLICWLAISARLESIGRMADRHVEFVILIERCLHSFGIDVD